MAKFEPKRFDISQINGGNKFNIGDGVTAEAINAPIESAAFSQSLATNSPNISEIDTEGTPSVSIEYMADGSPRFVFEHLRGKTGNSGLNYGASLSNSVGESDTNGYTQYITNSLISNPNLFINGDFKVNQRGSLTYSQDQKYSLDRWIPWNVGAGANFVISVNSDGSITITNNGNNPVVFLQYIDGYKSLSGKTITFSANIKSISGSVTMSGYDGVDNTFGVTTSSVGLLKQSITLSNDLYKREFYRCGIGVLAHSSVTISYLKLEVGNLATKNSPRPYEEELAICERFYQEVNFSMNTQISGGLTNGSTCYAVLQHKTNMRVFPTITFAGNYNLYNGLSGRSIAITNISITAPQTWQTTLGITHSTTDSENSTVPPSSYLSLRMLAGSKITLDAEIY